MRMRLIDWFSYHTDRIPFKLRFLDAVRILWLYFMISVHVTRPLLGLCFCCLEWCICMGQTLEYLMQDYIFFLDLPYLHKATIAWWPRDNLDNLVNLKSWPHMVNLISQGILKTQIFTSSYAENTE